MNVFVAGATGALGRQLVPQLVAAGHDVVGMTRSPDKTGMLRAVRARRRRRRARSRRGRRGRGRGRARGHRPRAHRPDGDLDLKRPEFFVTTNRLRTEGTDHLLAAGRAVGIRRFIAQSTASYTTYARTGGPVKTEVDPLDPDPPATMRPNLEAIRHVEDAVTGMDWAEGVVLRYGVFYGPGTGISADPTPR